MAFVIPRNQTIIESLGQALGPALAGGVAMAQRQLGTEQYQQTLGSLLGVTPGATPQSVAAMDALNQSRQSFGLPTEAVQPFTPGQAQFNRLSEITDPAMRQAVLGSLLQAQYGDPFGEQRARADLLRAQTGQVGQPTPLTPEEKALKEAETAKIKAETGQLGETKSETQLIARLGEKIINGKATKKDVEVFNRLTEKAGTNIFTGDIQASAEQQIQHLNTLQSFADKMNINNPDAPNRYVVETSPTRGPYLAIKEKDKMTATERDVANKTDRVKRTLLDIRELVKNNRGKMGPVQGVVTKAKTATVGDPFGARLESKLTQLLERMYAISGKQLSDKEIARWAKMFPSIVQPDVSFDATLDEFIRAVAADQEFTQQQMQELGIFTGTNTGANTAPTSIDAIGEKFGF